MPAVILSFFVAKEKPEGIYEEVELRHGAWFVVILFVLTIAMAVCAHNYLHLPPVIGMMTGLGILKMFGYYLNRRDHYFFDGEGIDELEDEALELDTNNVDSRRMPERYNIFKAVERAEWDTLMFFYGVILSVGGLGALGYLAVGSQIMYEGNGSNECQYSSGCPICII